TERCANASRIRTISARSGSWEASTLLASRASVPASERARAAWMELRLDRSTTNETRSATRTKTASATALSASFTVRSRQGGVNSRLSSRLPHSAEASAGHSPPTSATATVPVRKQSMSVVRPRSEERRVGKECSARWQPTHKKKSRLYLLDSLIGKGVLRDSEE